MGHFDSIYRKKNECRRKRRSDTPLSFIRNDWYEYLVPLHIAYCLWIAFTFRLIHAWLAQLSQHTHAHTVHTIEKVNFGMRMSHVTLCRPRRHHRICAKNLLFTIDSLSVCHVLRICLWCCVGMRATLNHRGHEATFKTIAFAKDKYLGSENSAAFVCDFYWIPKVFAERNEWTN